MNIVYADFCVLGNIRVLRYKNVEERRHARNWSYKSISEQNAEFTQERVCLWFSFSSSNNFFSFLNMGKKRIQQVHSRFNRGCAFLFPWLDKPPYWGSSILEMEFPKSALFIMFDHVRNGTDLLKASTSITPIFLFFPPLSLSPRYCLQLSITSQSC